MRLTASTRLVDNMCPSFTDELSIMKEFGFEGVDQDIDFKLSERVGGNWQERVERVAMLSEDINMPIVQTHLPYNYVHGWGPQAPDEEALRQAILATEMLNSKYAVFHAVSTEKREDGLARTYEFYMPYVEFAYKHNVEMLIEIMPDYCNYPRTAEELCQAADKMGIGVCWDFGHPNVNKYKKNGDQRDELRLIGQRLKALHVNDNGGGKVDEHLPPYLGSVDWDTHIPVLKEIGYKGDFNYEVLQRRIPNELLPNVAKYLIETGRRLMNMCR